MQHAQQIGFLSGNLAHAHRTIGELVKVQGVAYSRVTDAISGVSGTVRAIASVVAELPSADGAGLLCEASNGGARLLCHAGNAARSLPNDDCSPPDDPDDAFSDADLSSLDVCEVA